jgi:hypothetical protein
MSSCENSESTTYNDGDSYYYFEGANGGISIPYKIAVDNPTSIVSYADLSSLQRGTVMKLRVNRKDFEVWEVDVVFDALYTTGRHRLILCHSPAGFPIGAGDSGSPLLTSDGKVAGILAYGYYGNSTDFAARVIEDVLAIDTSASLQQGSPPPSFEPIEPAYFASGLDPQVPSRYAGLMKRFEKNTKNIDKPFRHENRLRKSGDQSVIPGSSIAVVDMSGDYFNWIAIGTVSYIDGDTYYGFGHSFYPFLAAPTYLATTGSFIVSNSVSFKMSQPTSERIGAFTKNDYRGILIQKNVSPRVANLKTTCSSNGRVLFSYNHQMSNTLNFSSDQSWAAYLTAYFVYLATSSMGSQSDTLHAFCTAVVASELETKTKTFSLYDTWVDWRIYQYFYDSLQLNAASKELKQFDLSVDLSE